MLKELSLGRNRTPAPVHPLQWKFGFGFLSEPRVGRDLGLRPPEAAAGKPLFCPKTLPGEGSGLYLRAGARWEGGHGVELPL